MSAPTSLHGIVAELPELVALRLRAAQLGRVERQRSADQLSGPQASPFRGRGMEYAESRPYAAGDDVRHIDWRVTARTGRTHTKLFQPERERITAVVYDAAPSMAFGTRTCFKSVQAARIGALMAWAALAEGDRLAASACGRACEVVAPMGARRGVLRTLDALVRWQRSATAAASPASLAEALDALQRRLRPGSHVLLLLDPRSLDIAAERSLVRLRAHHDLAACVLADPIEVTPPKPARYRIAGLGGQRSTLQLDDGVARVAWTGHFRQQHDDVIGRLRRAGARARLTLTHEDPVHALRDLLNGAPQRSDPA
ncbi:MAG: DUF58 domain-containing protein [Chiayiivirga sp.]|jgi:uncharacterized protein (DUF58 family)|uniref:DUF58 domain-containing protein n=1 Tax=Chiayiivirga sp. TaxID=2041042 RepID=UPI0025C1BD0D|nr:DUF58 domain-containing protein [Chiayiivirga sp.]MCI1728565.1 DUF58 domain-containing protein [Chiayiivirga sp.]